MITWTKRLSWVAILSRLARSRRLTEAERDACAAGVDRCSELGATVEEGRDFIDVIIDEAGAPDGSSLISAVRDLKARALERDRAIAELDGQCVRAINAIKACDLYSEWHRDSLERAEKAEKERDALKAKLEAAINLEEYERAFSKQCLAGVQTQSGRVESLKAAVRKVAKERDERAAFAKAETEHANKWAKLADERRAKLSALESSPIHPAIARVVENATKYASARTCGTTEAELKARDELVSSVSALPIPLPQAPEPFMPVTCIDCKHLQAEDGMPAICLHDDGPKGSLDPDGFCHLGNRGEVKL